MAENILLQIAMRSDSDAEELSRETFFTRRQLLDLDLASVEFQHDREAPIGAKAGNAAELGTLVICGVPTAAVAQGIIDLLLMRIRVGACRSARLTMHGNTLELTGLTETLQEHVVEEWFEHQRSHPQA